MADYLKTYAGDKVFPLAHSITYTSSMRHLDSEATFFVDQSQNIQAVIDKCEDNKPTDIVLSGIFRPEKTLTIPENKIINIIGGSLRGSFLSSRYTRTCGQETKIYVGDTCPQWIFVNGKVRYPAATSRDSLFRAACTSLKDDAADTMTTKIKLYKADCAKIAAMDYSQAWVTILYRWMSYKCRIDSVDLENAQLVCTQTIGTAGGNVLHDMSGASLRIIVENLNIPACQTFNNKDTWQNGTYYVQGGYLYYKHAENEDIYADIEIPKVETLLDIKGECRLYDSEICYTNHVFDNTCYEGKGYSGRQACARFNAAVMVSGKCDIQNCDFHHTTNHCVKLMNESYGCNISENKFHDLGCSSIVLGFVPLAFKVDIPTTATQAPQVMNNSIVSVGRIYAGAAGLSVFYASNYIIKNNLIRGTYYTGITTGYTWTAATNPNKNGEIANNVIDLVGVGPQALFDGGGIYNLGNASNLKIHDNIITNIYGDETNDHRLVGLYFDESSSNIDVYNNLILNTYYSYQFNTITSSVSVHNNIFALPIKTCCYGKSSGSVTGNVFIFNSCTYANVKYSGITKNCWYQIGGETTAAWDTNPTIGNPFVDYASKDWRISDSNIATAIGFVSFDIKPQVRDLALSDQDMIDSYLQNKYSANLPK